MTLSRTLFLILAGLGMLFQFTATAAASPVAPTTASECEQMAMMEADDGLGLPPREGYSCSEMSLDCLVAMQCLVTVGTVDNPTSSAANVAGRQQVIAFLAMQLPTLTGPPDSPPPIFPHA